MSTPRRPAEMYLDEMVSSKVEYDPNLVLKAIAFREEKGLVKHNHYYLNVTVWKFQLKDGPPQPGVPRFEYLCCTNESDEEAFNRAAKIKEAKAKITLNEAKKYLRSYPAYSGTHSEQNMIIDILSRHDSGDVKAMFTERAPCFECRAFIRQHYRPATRIPIYYYIPYKPERKWVMQWHGNDIMTYMLFQYGI